VRENVWSNFISVLLPRLQQGGGCLICCTRWQVDDLPGRLVEREADRWKVLSYASECRVKASPARHAVFVTPLSMGVSPSTPHNLILLCKSLARHALTRHATQSASAHKNRGARRLPVPAFGNQKFSFKPNWMLRRSGGGVVMALGGMMPLKAWIPVRPGALRSRFPVLM